MFWVAHLILQHLIVVLIEVDLSKDDSENDQQVTFSQTMMVKKLLCAV